MRESTWLRAGASCAFLYVLVFVSGQVYLGSQPQVSYPAKSNVDEQTRLFLVYAHQHSALVTAGALMAVLGYLLLGGVMGGMLPALYPQRHRLARIALVIGLLSSAIVLVGVVVEATELAGAARQLTGSDTPAVQLRVIHDFRDRTLPFQVLDLAGSLGVALWLGLVGLTLLQILGRNSVAAWGTVGSSLLAGIGFPVLVAWAAAAGLGLWRLSRGSLQVAPDAWPATVGADEDAAPEPQPPLSRARATGARGGKGRRKRRR